ncbi:hypothetical protein GALMADRAFT_849655 [Galerina marginata CBS 339.88]|uniref:GSKIP domain-containing protein n=1 Tax=Galerina marginata (strain CBS 339.88) TaxID=685588 RepID=A0A067TUX5_GALM3|nr:hypothetical protein GALMADRAFT_849655 [Galerina marginata CBS 339.88]
MMTLADLYNLWCVSGNAPKKLGSLFDSKGRASMTVSSSSSSFCQTELHRALKEQVFGIKSFTVLSSSLEQASASVILLEGPKVIIQLTTQGYCVVSAGATSRIHETIEDLLQSTSPLYAKKRHEVLMAKLARLS